MSMEIFVNGARYTYWEQASVERSLDSVCGQFSFTTSPTPKSRFPIQPDAEVEIIVDGLTVLTGYVEVIHVDQSSDSSSFSVSGRDNICDLIDSGVPEEVKSFQESIGLQEIILRIISAIGIRKLSVISLASNITPFSAKEIEAFEFGGNALDFITSIARKRNVFITSDGNGRLILYYPPFGIHGGRLTHNENDRSNNILSLEYKNDRTQLFNVYKCSAQDNASANGLQVLSKIMGKEPPEDVKNGNIFTDSDVRSGRYVEIQAEEAMNTNELKKRAEEESNIRRARSLTYGVTIQGHALDGEVLRCGYNVMVNDSIFKQHGSFLIKRIVYTADLSSGSTTKLDLTYQRSYTGKGSVVARTCSTGTPYSG